MGKLLLKPLRPKIYLSAIPGTLFRFSIRSLILFQTLDFRDLALPFVSVFNLVTKSIRFLSHSFIFLQIWSLFWLNLLGIFRFGPWFCFLFILVRWPKVDLICWGRILSGKIADLVPALSHHIYFSIFQLSAYYLQFLISCLFFACCYLLFCYCFWWIFRGRKNSLEPQ